MQQSRLFFFLSVICLSTLVPVSRAQSANGFEEMQKGRQALGQAKYDEAIEHFEKVLSINVTNINAHLYLGNAYAQKFVPGVNSPDNVALADQAIDHYQKVLDNDRFSNLSLTAAKSIALLYAQMNKFDESKSYYARAKQLDPKDPEPYYFTALIDWTLASQFRKQQWAKLNLKPEDPIPAKYNDVCIEVKGKNSPNLEDGIDNLNKALQLNPRYEDAMKYMNLIYLERSDVECNDPASRKADLKTADEWTQKLAALKKMKAAPPHRDEDEDQ